MEFLVISNEKIKITLTKGDMDEYGLDAESMDYNVDHTRRAIKEILKVAKTERGFDVDGDRIFIQAFPGRQGGCELYISKMGELPVEFSKNPSSDSSASCQRDGLVAVFDSLLELISFCNVIGGTGEIKEDAVFFDSYKSSYLLTFYPVFHHDQQEGRQLASKLLASLIKEFGGRCDRGCASPLRSPERYKCICEVGAVELFKKLNRPKFSQESLNDVAGVYPKM